MYIPAQPSSGNTPVGWPGQAPEQMNLSLGGKPCEGPLLPLLHGHLWVERIWASRYNLIPSRRGAVPPSQPPPQTEGASGEVRKSNPKTVCSAIETRFLFG